MNLKPINPPVSTDDRARRVLCCKCGKWTATLADLDGEPFKAYYCEPCADALRAPVDTSDDAPRACGICGGPLVPLGTLGRLAWSRCRNCGSQEVDRTTGGGAL